MKKLTTLIVLAALAAATARAQGETTDALVIQMTTGETATFVLDERPKITFTPGNLVITSATYTTEYPLADLQHYTFKQVLASNIAQPETGGQPTIEQADGQIILGNLPSGTTVTVYSIGGMAISTLTATDDGRATISSAALAPGVYIIKYGDKSLKIRKQ